MNVNVTDYDPNQDKAHNEDSQALLHTLFSNPTNLASIECCRNKSSNDYDFRRKPAVVLKS